MAAMSADTLMLSVVIPCLNEAERLPLLIADLQRWPLPIEITVVVVAVTITALALATSLVAASSRSIHLGGASNWLQVPSTPSNKTKANGSFFSMPIVVCQATGEAAC